jgi:hypothetical protein
LVFNKCFLDAELLQSFSAGVNRCPKIRGIFSVETSQASKGVPEITLALAVSSGRNAAAHGNASAARTRQNSGTAQDRDEHQSPLASRR